MKTDKKFLQKLDDGCVPTRAVEITKVFSLFLRCCQEPFYFAGELHEQWEIVYIRKGEAIITADDRVFQLPAGSLIFHKPMEFHQIVSETAGLEIFVSSFNMTGDAAYKLKASVFQLLPEEIGAFEELIDRCVRLNQGCYQDRDYRNSTPLWRESPLEFSACVQQMEMIFYKLLMRSPASKKTRHTADSVLYQKIVAILEDHIYTDITIEQVANLCGVSASSVKNCFSRHSGCGLHKYFLKIKIREAIRLIREGRSISSVSDTLGFNNPNYFSFVFQRETGKRPTDYRQS